MIINYLNCKYLYGLLAFIVAKLINMVQNLFFYVPVNCNLAIEFNGLVSIKGYQK
jgi:hypothetical protein